MLRNYIESRERFFHGRDNNRRSLPFEWGLDHLGLQANRNFETPLRDFVSNALLDSSSFYGCNSTEQYDFDGEILKFPSAIETPFAENNTVWGRFFGAGRDLAMVVLPQWNCKWDSQLTLCRVLQRAGITSLRLSLPYHHHRRPAHLERSEYLVSPNIGRTLTAVRQAVLDSRRAADWLFARGYNRVGILGTSIGSCVGFLAFAHDQRFSTGVFIHISSFFADVVWTGLSTKHVRQSLEGAIDLQRLRFLWSPISPYPFIKRLRGTNRRSLMISGRYDLTFLPELSQQAYDEFQRQRVPCQIAWLPCGHYTMGQFPFNALAGYRIVKFLRK
ncbi:MAG TPA: abhydrolase domain-containing 18 [Terriglobia bacterium]|nr:abhydrolase domain-containing 18 [Terriglobia bacterium]